MRFADILNETGINGQVLKWNLMILSEYNCIQAVLCNKTKIYACKDIPEKKMLLYYFLRNQSTRVLISSLLEKSVKLKQLCTDLGISYNNAYYSINLLHDQNIIQSIVDGSEVLYTIHEDYREEIMSILADSAIFAKLSHEFN